MPSIKRINTFTITFPPYLGTGNLGAPVNSNPTVPTGSFTLAIPDNSVDFYAIGVNLAGIASSVVALATAIQTIYEPTGGIRVKDMLDPYQYQVVTQALTASGIPTPGQPPSEIITANPLGGAMAAAGQLAGLAGSAAALAGTQAIDAFMAGTIGTGPIVALPLTGFPDYNAPLTVINSSLGVISTAIGSIASMVTASVDVPSRALVLKSVMSLFSSALNTQSIATAGRVPPVPPAGL